MKKYVLITSIVAGLTILTAFTNTDFNEFVNIEVTNTSDYCDGWDDGYCEGWKDVKGMYAICPITPICPIAEVGKNRYRDGYNRGFKAGSNAAHDQ